MHDIHQRMASVWSPRHLDSTPQGGSESKRCLIGGISCTIPKVSLRRVYECGMRHSTLILDAKAAISDIVPKARHTRGKPAGLLQRMRIRIWYVSKRAFQNPLQIGAQDMT